MDELDYEHHLSHWKRMVGPGASTQLHAFAVNNAEHDHALAVLTPLFDLSAKVSLELPDKLGDREAQIYLRHGVGRRLQDMHDSYREITTLAYHGRAEPLQPLEQREFSRHLNSFYINLRGVLDNFAYCFAPIPPRR
jgi:hypothetical protein